MPKPFLLLPATVVAIAWDMVLFIFKVVARSKWDATEAAEELPYWLLAFWS